MSKILFQGSTGAIGDFFLSTHPMIHLSRMGHQVFVALDKKTPESTKDLYRSVPEIEIIELDDISESIFLKYCRDNAFKPIVYLKTLQHLNSPHFYPLKDWFKYEYSPTLSIGNYVGFQVVSSSNYARPKIDHLESFIDIIAKHDYEPIFMGTKKDGELFENYYESLSSRFKLNPLCWRFGQDTLTESISNIRLFHGMITFSSWTAYAAVFQGIPTLEFWSMDQWMLYTSMVRVNLGNPIHYTQDYFKDEPSPHLIELFKMSKNMARNFYGNFT